MKQLQKLKKKAGFTLIEVITTIFIMSLLMILILPNIHRIREFAEQKQSQAFFQNVQNQVDLFRGQYPEYEVTLPNLLEHGYISKAQAEQINREKILIQGNQIKRGS